MKTDLPCLKLLDNNSHYENPPAEFENFIQSDVNASNVPITVKVQNIYGLT